MTRSALRDTALIACCVLAAATAAGCGGAPKLMPSPTLYVDGMVDPFDGVPEPLRHNRAPVVYVTDRVCEDETPGKRRYGYKRSRSVEFGLSEVQFGGPGVSWDELVRASRARQRDAELDLSITRTDLLGQFPPTPRHLLEARGANPAADADAAERAADARFGALLREQLAHTRVKEVYIFVHGFANTFDDGVMTIAQLWHFFGREGVPVAYTWPAGSPGLLSYMYDRESSEFTVYHLKQALKLIASVPEVRKVHVMGHSRGTDVVSSALRELHLEISGAGKSSRDELKLGTVVLAAPDLDLDVVIQRMATARVGQVPENTAIYICKNDKALGLSNWLFSGMTRLGRITSSLFAPDELHTLRHSHSPQIIDARVTNVGSFGHDYFHSNPAVSSDLILLMRYQFAPGAQNGRPLRVDPSGFWVIDDDYPGPQRNPVKQ